MTVCSTFVKSIEKRVEAGKSLDDIANELCTDVEFNREKVIRVIREFLGESYLVEHASTLGYDVDKAELAKKANEKKTHKKIDATTDADYLTTALNRLLKKYSIDEIKKALEKLEKS